MGNEAESSVVITLSHHLNEAIEHEAEIAQITKEELIGIVLSFLEESKVLINEEMSKKELIMQILKKDGELSWLRYRNDELQSDNEKLIIKLNGCDSMLKICERSLNLKENSYESKVTDDYARFTPDEQKKMEKKYLKK